VRSVFEAQSQDFCTLAKGNSLQYLAPGDEAPKGCCVKVLSENASLLVNLTGILDIDVEIARLTKEMERLAPRIDEYKRKISAPGYEKVKEDVRTLNAEKLESYESELAAVVAAKTAFEAMK
jgi:valyl-tRNA synthetase